MEDDIKENNDGEMYLEPNEQTTPASETGNLMTEIDEHNIHNEIRNQTISGIDNKWYTFVTNDQACEEELGTMVDNETAIETKRTGSLIVAKDINTPLKGSEGLFECDICKKSFNSKGNLNRHKRIHTGETNFECATCKKRFLEKSKLKIHERIHTGEVPYECRTCKVRFKQLGHLDRHERIHTGEMPFECVKCKKRFNRKFTLDVHERNHTGEVPYECKTCEKRFKQNSDLKRHARIHTGEMPYKET